MGTVHIVGAGLAGLGAAVALIKAGRQVVVYDQAGHAGGRCRSFHDGTLERRIDNGNHLLFSGNHAARGFLDDIGAGDSLTGPRRPVFPFVDLETGRRWTVRISRGRIPWWILRPSWRVPDTGVLDYVSAIRLAWAGPDATMADCFDVASPIFKRFWQPLSVAILNTSAEEAAAAPLWPVLVETFGRGGMNCRPLIARHGLSDSFVDPAVAWLTAGGAALRFSHRLRRLKLANGRSAGLDFGRDGEVELAGDDKVVLAIPPDGVHDLVPSVPVPTQSRAIVNAHYRVGEVAAFPDGSPLLGVLGGTAQWIFRRGDVVSVTVSAADRLAERPTEEIVRLIWGDVARALELPAAPMAPARLVKEKRATFAQTPAAMARRAKTETAFANLFLAGDWTDTGLPATIEGAIRSGRAAAAAVLAARD
ncbi:MAG: hydroxysqualene dehydroxylase HpnE [Kiloniellales bacterium]